MNYEEDIRIEETALDVEWLEQPGLMLRYSRHAANCRIEVDKAKEAFDLVKAELDKEIRSFPDRFGIEKITDKVVESTLPMQLDYKEASERLINAKFELDVAQGAVKAIDARKDALENLGRLLGLQYFAGPKIPRDLAEEKEARQKKINSSIAGKLRRRG
jgi:hypothetical protein